MSRRKTMSEHERIQKGIAAWEAKKEEIKMIKLSSWIQFYHKPYQSDWIEARKKAIEKRWEVLDK